MSERSSTLSVHEPELMVRARSWGLSRVRLQLFNLDGKRKTAETHLETRRLRLGEAPT